MPEQEVAKLHGAPTPAKRKRRWWIYVIDAVLLVVFLLAFAVSANVIYLNASFGEPFYVNGASMYPTLNRDGFHRTSDGELVPLTWDSSRNGVGDIVDYGWAKGKDKLDWHTDIGHYDIVITYYPSDYSADGTLKAGASLKIKRVVGLPGETVTLSYDTDNTAWGKTTITEPDGDSYVLPALYDASDFPPIDGYEYEGIDRNRLGTWTLGDDEFFLVGDNRGANHSEDSRSPSVGPIKGDYIQAKAFLLTGMRELEEDSSGSLSPAFLLSRVRMPWDYIHLDGGID